MTERGGELADRARAALRGAAAHGAPLTYQALAGALAVEPPNRIHQVTTALEALMREDAATGRPFIAALVVSKTRNGLPAPGFFDLARRLGRFDGAPTEPAMRAYHQAELEAAVRYWAQRGESAKPPPDGTSPDPDR